MNEMLKPRNLNEADYRSLTWTRLKKDLEERLEKYRRKNDGNLSESETTKLRGRIAEIKFMLDLDSSSGPAQSTDAGE